MPIRKIVLAQDEIYHVLNRGVAGQPIFGSHKHYMRFLELVDYYRFSNTPVSFSTFKKLNMERRNRLLHELVAKNELQIVCYAFCLMPNHFHFLIRQIAPNGINSFMRHLQDGYAKYFNITTKRYGPLYQSVFKAVRVENEEQLLHVSRYVHINPTTAYLSSAENLVDYPWSSFSYYVQENTVQYAFVDTKTILTHFKSREEYKKFTYDQIDYQRELRKIKHLLLE